MLRFSAIHRLRYNTGYTPGYCGTVVSQDNIVVYGTGCTYTPYVGAADWVPQPHTYGIGVAFSWSATAGWGFAKPTWDGIGEAFAVNVCRCWEHWSLCRNPRLQGERICR
jgi:hypothetical protein